MCVKRPWPIAFLCLLTLVSVGCARAQGPDAAAVARGRAAFAESCALCHDVSPARSNGQGPGLFGVVGRPIASLEGFAYSDTLKQAGTKGQTWTRERLIAYMRDPQAAMPGTAMPVGLADPTTANDVATYLSTLWQGGAQAAAAGGGASGRLHDWRNDAPGVVHDVRVKDLPKPYATPSAGNSPTVLRNTTPDPKVPNGMAVSVFSRDTERPRSMKTAPNGDVFVLETGRGRLSLYRNVGGKLEAQRLTFAEGLDRPAGIAFFPNGANPEYIYVAGVSTLVRIPYRNGDVKARGAPEMVIEQLARGGGHSNRDVVFSPDNKYMYITVGSVSNVYDGMSAEPAGGLAAHEASNGMGASWGMEEWRAQVMRYTPDGKNRQNLATGLRNCVALAVRPGTGDVYCTINERDGLGDNLVPDYFTKVTPGAFYGWPWYYLGNNPDPRHNGARPDLKNRVSLPDVLFVSHSAPLGFAFYEPVKGASANLPQTYWGDAFVALHGSWNRAERTGTKVVRVLFKDGKPTGQYEDFMTGLIVDDRSVTARPAGVTVGPDGALYVSDDAAGYIWRIGPK